MVTRQKQVDANASRLLTIQISRQTHGQWAIKQRSNIRQTEWKWRTEAERRRKKTPNAQKCAVDWQNLTDCERTGVNTSNLTRANRKQVSSISRWVRLAWIRGSSWICAGFGLIKIKKSARLNRYDFLSRSDIWNLTFSNLYKIRYDTVKQHIQMMIPWIKLIVRVDWCVFSCPLVTLAPTGD